MFPNNYLAQDSTPKSGGLARLMSMGQNLYVEDPQDIKTNPAYGSIYDNFLWGDLGTTKTKWGNDGNSQFFGVNIRLNNAITVGAILAKNDQTSEMSITSVDPFYLSQDAQLLSFTPNNNTEIFASMLLDNISLGFGVSYMTAEMNQSNGASTTQNIDLSFSQLGLNAGIIMDLPNKNKFDVALSVLFPGAKRVNSAQTDETSQTIIKADARAFFTLNEKIKFVPLMNFLVASGTDGTTYNSGSIKSDSYDLASRTQFLLGAGINYRLDNFLFAGGPSVLMTSDKYTTTTPSTKNTSTSLIWNLGAEWYCTSWLTTRVGYKAFTGSVTVQTPSTTFGKINETTQTVYGVDDGFTFGLGFKLNRFSLDATVNTDVLRQGLNNIGGGGATLGFLSTSYAF